MLQWTVMAERNGRIAEEDVTRIVGEPTAEDVDQLENECVEIEVKFETGLFQGGDELGHMFMLVVQQRYCDELGDQTYVSTVPFCLEAFDPELAGAAGKVLQKRQIAEHKWKIYEYEMFKEVTQGLREKILYAVD